MKLLHILFFVLFFLQISAQNETVLLIGQVKNDSIQIADVHIVNLNSNKGAFSDINGSFRIHVSLNDTIKLSSVMYSTRNILIDNDIFKNPINRIFYLNTHELNEVVVTYKENIVNALSLGLPNASKKPLNKFERKLEYYDLKETFKVMPYGISINLENIYYILSVEDKKDKKLKKFLENDELEIIKNEKVLQIREYFGDAFFINTIKIPKENIDSLINYCLSKNIIFLFERSRYLEIIDIFMNENNNFQIKTGLR